MAKDDLPRSVILLNFGGPSRAEEVEPFLYRLFTDPFIIRSKMPELVRRFIARRISVKRAPKVAVEYQKIGYSPINRMTEIQARHLEAELRKTHANTSVRIINRYTAPFAEDVVKSLAPDKERLYLVTLYPHLCHSTTVSSLRDFDLAFEKVHGHRNIPSVRVFSWWHHPRYLDHTFAQLKATLEPALERAQGEPITLLFSAHGIPARYNLRGDPYVTETQGHYTELKRRGEAWLKAFDGGRHAGRCHWQLSFQSRVGPVEWVRPYTDEKVLEIGKSRGGMLIIVPISFTSDHIETLFEMDETYRNLAMDSGFKSYARVAPSNDDPELAACLADVLRQHGF